MKKEYIVWDEYTGTNRNCIEYHKHIRKTIKNCIIMFFGSLIFWGIFYILVLIVYC